MRRTLTTELQDWYLAQCDGEWEHFHGISIVTSDNPAWNVQIDITGTTFDTTMFENSELRNHDDTDWYHCSLSEDKTEFFGVGDPTKLESILEHFLKFVK